MGFNTLSFIPFLLIVILLYFTIFRKCQWVFLLLASIAFYLFAGPKYIIDVYKRQMLICALLFDTVFFVC